MTEFFQCHVLLLSNVRKLSHSLQSHMQKHAISMKNKLTYPKNGIYSLPMLYKGFSLVLFFLKKRTNLCSNLG